MCVFCVRVLPVGRCLLRVVYNALCGVCCASLRVVGCLLFGVCWFVRVGCCSLLVVRCVFFAVW